MADRVLAEVQETHPWITFELKLMLAPELWLLLGEGQSKCAHIAGVPLKGATADELERIYLAKGIQATTAIEGNTLTARQVKEQLDGQLQLPPSQAYLAKEVENIAKALELIKQSVPIQDYTNLSPLLVKEINGLVLDRLPNDGIQPGEYRTHSVVVGNTYRAVPARFVSTLMDRLCSWMNEITEVAGQRGFVSAFIKAILMHIYLAWIHPFGDGNGRTARLMEVLCLLTGGVPRVSAHLLSKHYNDTRTEYYRHLDTASKNGGDVTGFVLYALRGFVDGLVAQLDVIRNQQLHLAWHDYVEQVFRSEALALPTAERRKLLVMEITAQGEPVQRDQVRRLSPLLTVAYHDKTDKTITRDLNWLLERGLIKQSGTNLYLAQSDTMLAFLPDQLVRSRARSRPQRDLSSDDLDFDIRLIGEGYDETNEPMHAGAGRSSSEGDLLST